MNTNINELQEKFTSDIVKYDNTDLDTIIGELNSAVTLLGETIAENIKNLTNYDSVWEGEAKKQYLALKDDFVKPYCDDFGVAVTDYRDAVNGLKTLLGTISSSNKIKEIDNA